MFLMIDPTISSNAIRVGDVLVMPNDKRVTFIVTRVDKASISGMMGRQTYRVAQTVSRDYFGSAPRIIAREWNM